MNPEHATNWLPGVMALGAATAVALVYLLGSKRLRDDAPAAETVDDLEARYQRLLGELKEHRANQHLLDAETWKAEQARLEQAAAAVLRERDGKRHEVTKAQARAEKRAGVAASDPSFFGRNPALKGALAGGAVVAFFVLLGVLLSQSATERAAGDSITGGGPTQPMQPAPPPPDSKLQALASRVQSSPEDADAVADLAVYLLRQQAFQEARALADRTAMLDPFHAKGRVARAVMKAVDGNVRGAIDELERLASRYPEAYDGHLFAGLLALEDNDPRRGLADLEAFLATAPQADQPPFVRMTLQQLKQQLEAQP